jgi:hypothetical protein
MKTYGGVLVKQRYREVSGQFHISSILISGEIPWHPLDRRQGGIHSRSGLCGKENYVLPL